jgi:hypothetical protein
VIVIGLLTSPDDHVGGKRGSQVSFARTDMTSTEQVYRALDVAEQRGQLRAVVHCTTCGIGIQVVGRHGKPGPQEIREEVGKLNLAGNFNALRLAGTCMSRAEPPKSEGGVCAPRASVAAWEGQTGQIPRASAKAGIVGIALVAVRDVAGKLLGVTKIAHPAMDALILDRIRPDVKKAFEASVPNPPRLGQPREFADLALAIIGGLSLMRQEDRLDGVIRMAS